jgi:hypothetical protein
MKSGQVKVTVTQQNGTEYGAGYLARSAVNRELARMEASGEVTRPVFFVARDATGWIVGVGRRGGNTKPAWSSAWVKS